MICTLVVLCICSVYKPSIHLLWRMFMEIYLQGCIPINLRTPAGSMYSTDTYRLDMVHNRNISLGFDKVYMSLSTVHHGI